MKPKPGNPAIVAATGRRVRILAVAQGNVMVRSSFGNWTYRVDELRTGTGKRFTQEKRNG